MSYVIKRKSAIIFIDLLIYCICLLGLFQVYFKADLPFQVTSNGRYLVISDVFDNNLGVNIGDKITAVDGYQLNSREELEVLLDGKNPGESVELSYQRDNSEYQGRITLIPFYSVFYLITAGIVGSLFILFALFVLLKRFKENPAHLFHWLIFGSAVIMTTTWGNYNIPLKGIGIITRIFFHSAYTFTPLLFVHFAMVFPSQKFVSAQKVLTVLYFIAALIAASQVIAFWKLFKNPSLENIRGYILYFDISRIFLSVLIISAIALFIHSHKKTSQQSDKKKLKWIIGGFLIGPLGFTTLWVIPQAITTHGLVPEEIILFLILAVPLTFSIAIIKYQLMDIDVIINRSIVYSIAVSCLLILYVLIVSSAAYLLDNPDSGILSVAAAVIIALLFQPMRVKVQKFVDQKFFRVQYNFREALKEMLSDIRNANDIKTLASILTEKIDLLIPMERIGFFRFNLNENRLRLLAHNNFDQFEKHSIRINPAKFNPYVSVPLAHKDFVETGITFEAADSKIVKLFRVNLIFSLKTVNENFLGFLVLGRKNPEQNTAPKMLI
ncbi:MAG: PDZ domain-containing protein [Bacteroidetes bacterium]|nr:PDZ domain-containing protein [Bacteroidota bacterium]